jgi:predicted HicB family RNase H-like nuclease
MLKHKGYIGSTQFDAEDEVFHGRVIGIRDVITFQGTSVEELKQAFADSVEDYLEFCAERGEEPEKPYSGKFVLRLPEEAHRLISSAAQLSNKSLNTWAAENLIKAAKNEFPELDTILT